MKECVQRRALVGARQSAIVMVAQALGKRFVDLGRRSWKSLGSLKLSDATGGCSLHGYDGGCSKS